MNEKLWGMVKKHRDNGISVTDEEAESVYKLCVRVIPFKKVNCKDEIYLELLYEEELKNYLIRRFVNEASLALLSVKEMCENVQYVHAEPLPS